MTPKQKRDRLFKKDRPLIRPFQLMENGEYSKDLKILWVAHKVKPFEALSSTKEEDFIREVLEVTGGKSLYVADDFNDEYEKKGPVGVITVDTDGWKVEPHVDFFPWATKRNILRVSVGFFQMIRYQKIGVCVVHALKESKNLFDHCIPYGVLHYSGAIFGGDPRGDDYLYSVRGKKHV